jgi:membrane protease YdiL (CAAX protease family)
MFHRSTLFDFLVISLLAGLGEELLFRWSLQGGITSVLETRIGLTAAVVVGLAAASVMFGICHWVNSAYGITTIVIGAYLGAVMIWSGSWIVPAVAHALYDFVALIYISRLPDQKTSTGAL